MNTSICSNIHTRKQIVFLLLILLFTSCSNESDLVKYVNPNIGTAHSRWFFYTPAALPFGMAKPAPTTNGHYGNKWGWEAVGYDDRHESIEGFANIHEFQLGGIVLMPTCGALITTPGKLENPDLGYRSRFKKESEIAQPGYYKVDLEDYGIRAELTSTKRIALHKYTFPANRKANLIFDIGNQQGESGKVVNAEVRRVDNYTVEGWVETAPEYVKKYQKGSTVSMYFVAKLNKAMKEFGTFQGDTIFANQKEISGKGVGLYFTFTPIKAESIEIQVALSYTSIENAYENLKAEAKSFNRAKKDAEKIWNTELNKIRVKGGSEIDKTKFYTGLYHALLGRGLANDINGAYLKHGYVPYDKGRFSNSLEYSFDDWTVSQFAKSLDKEADYKIFLKRGYYWKNIIDPETGFARMKDSKSNWLPDFDPYKSGANHHYVEGNSWQLTYFVPQDVPALAEMIGKDRFIERLDWGFEESNKTRFNGINDQYWNYPVVQGNQQSMHFAFLFNWVQQSWLTQKWSRAIMDRYYGYGISNAYLGDEDQGQMSAWFVMASMGLFQTDGGCRVDPVYEIASPLFEKIEIDLGKQFGRGEKFVIKANHASRLNKYVQSAKLNGKALQDFKFPASELLKGGELELEMGAEPNKKWGVQ